MQWVGAAALGAAYEWALIKNPWAIGNPVIMVLAIFTFGALIVFCTRLGKIRRVELAMLGTAGAVAALYLGALVVMDYLNRDAGG